MNWKYRGKSALVLLLVLSLTAGCLVPVTAEQSGGLIINLGEHAVLSNYLKTGGTIEMSVYQVASSDGKGGWKISNSQFASFGIIEAEAKLRKEEKDAGAGFQKILEKSDFLEAIQSIEPIDTVQMNDANQVVFSNLDPGIYYVRMTKGPVDLVVHCMVPIPFRYSGKELFTVQVGAKVENIEPKGEFELTATKMMAGRNLYEGDQFTFIVEPKNPKDAPMPEKQKVTINFNGGKNWEKFSFGKIKFTKEHIGKTFEYTIKEDPSEESKKNVIYDDASKTVTLKVEDGGFGKLKITSLEKEPVFSNKYEFSTWIPLTAFKELKGRDFIEGDKWKFIISPYPKENAPQVVNSEGEKVTSVTISFKDGKMVLDDGTEVETDGRVAAVPLGIIHFNQENIGKTYHYTISELKTDVKGVTYDSEPRRVEVKVTYDEDRTGVIGIDEQGGEYNNYYGIIVKSSSGDHTNMIEGVELFTPGEMEEATDSVTFKNIYNANGSKTFKGLKTLEGLSLLGRNKLLDEEFAFVITEDDKVLQTVYNDPDGKIVFQPIEYTLADVGTHTYKVYEIANEKFNQDNTIERDKHDYKEPYTVKIKVIDNGDGTLKAEPVDGYADPFKLDFVNKVKTNDLEIKKAFKDSKLLTASEKREEFPVTIKLTKDGKPYNGTFTMTRGSSVTDVVTFKDGQATVNAMYGAPLKIIGLPLEVKYEVAEAMTDSQQERYGTPQIDASSGEISDTASSMTITNTRDTADLIISKVLVNDVKEVDKDKVFTFKITLDDKSYEPIECTQYHQEADGTKQQDTEKVKFVKGEATVTTKGNQSVIISGLPVGVGYTIEEEKVPFFKNTEKVNDTGTITKDGVTATFTNERVVKPVSLTVIKKVENDTSTTASFPFTVTLSDTSINGTYGDMTFTDGVAKFNLKANEQKKATDLPSGISYKVEEDVPSGYTMESTGSSGTIDADAELGPDREARFVNTKVNTPTGGGGGGGGGGTRTTTATPSPTPDAEPDEPTPTPTPEPEYVTVEGRKTWDDGDNAAGKRPDSITIHLFADSASAYEEVASKTVTAEDGWAWSFTDLPAVDEYNLPIDYSIKEEPVPGYSTTYNGYNVTNSMKVDYTTATVQKIWEDDADPDHKMRPVSLKATLYSDDTAIYTVYLSEANGWKATVEDLPVYLNGHEINYTWKEDEVLGYKQTGFVKTDTVTKITNTLWQQLPPPDDIVPGPRPGTPEDEIDDYGTPLGLGVIINHVGDCFD